MKKLTFSILIILISFSISFAQDTVINLKNLSPQEAALALELQKKAHVAQNSEAANQISRSIKELQGIDVRGLNDWRVFITDTIKDICRDLNVSVNEFIKTPAGAGIAGLIIYKIAGKDILFTVVGKVFDIIFIIPFWFFIMIIIFWMRKRYFSTITIYKEITETENEKGKKVITKSKPYQTTSYEFHSNDSRQAMAGFLIGAFIVSNVVTFIVVFIKG